MVSLLKVLFRALKILWASQIFKKGYNMQLFWNLFGHFPPLKHPLYWIYCRDANREERLWDLAFHFMIQYFLVALTWSDLTMHQSFCFLTHYSATENNLHEQGEYYTKWISQTQMNKYCRIILTPGIYNSQAHRSRVQWWSLGVGGRRNGEMLIKGYTLSVIILKRSQDLRYSMVSKVNNTTLHNWNLLS